MKQKKLQGLFLIVCCIGSIALNAQTASGKLALTKGQKLQVDNSVKSVVNMDLMGQAMEITSDAVMMKQVEVKEKKDASYLVNSTITKMTTTGSAMGQTYSFDSDKKEDYDSEIGKAMKGQVNTPKEVELDMEGKVTNVKKDTGATGGGNPMMDMMKSMNGKDDGNAADAFLVLPAGKKNGDTWSDSTIADGIKTYRTYTFKEIKGNDATVTFTGTMQTNKTVEAQGMEMVVNMESKLSGDALVDIITGIIKQKTFTMDGTGTMDMAGQSVPMTTKVTTTTAVKSL